MPAPVLCALFGSGIYPPPPAPHRMKALSRGKHMKKNFTWSRLRSAAQIRLSEVHSTLMKIRSLHILLFAASVCLAQTAPKITTPKEFLGFNIGDDYMMASYTQLDKYWHKIASECDRCKLVDIGPTEEGRRQYMMIITSSANLKKLDHYRDIAARL